LKVPAAKIKEKKPMQTSITTFTPVSALVGGILIGAAAVLLMLFLGRIAGISGIVGGVLKPSQNDVAWRFAFVFGLLIAPIGVWAVTGSQPIVTVQASTPLLIAAGLLVGLGTRIGSGCTSGHGVCGMARLSRWSILATVTFLATGVATVSVMRHVFGGL
jgi:uncharacterized protein